MPWYPPPTIRVTPFDLIPLLCRVWELISTSMEGGETRVWPLLSGFGLSAFPWKNRPVGNKAHKAQPVKGTPNGPHPPSFPRASCFPHPRLCILVTGQLCGATRQEASPLPAVQVPSSGGGRPMVSLASIYSLLIITEVRSRFLVQPLIAIKPLLPVPRCPRRLPLLGCRPGYKVLGLSSVTGLQEFREPCYFGPPLPLSLTAMQRGPPGRNQYKA